MTVVPSLPFLLLILILLLLSNRGAEAGSKSNKEIKSKIKTKEQEVPRNSCPDDICVFLYKSCLDGVYWMKN